MTLIYANSDLERYKELEQKGVFNRGSKENEEFEKLRVKLKNA